MATAGDHVGGAEAVAASAVPRSNYLPLCQRAGR
jgi:hypothetical protein